MHSLWVVCAFWLRFWGKLSRAMKIRSSFRFAVESCVTVGQLHKGPQTSQLILLQILCFGISISISSFFLQNNSDLSQLSRIVLAAALWQHPHILILDELADYVDREELEALRFALDRFGGGVILVTEHAAGPDLKMWPVESGGGVLLNNHVKVVLKIVGGEERTKSDIWIYIWLLAHGKWVNMNNIGQQQLHLELIRGTVARNGHREVVHGRGRATCGAPRQGLQPMQRNAGIISGGFGEFWETEWLQNLLLNISGWQLGTTSNPPSIFFWQVVPRSNVTYGLFQFGNKDFDLTTYELL